MLARSRKRNSGSVRICPSEPACRRLRIQIAIAGSEDADIDGAGGFFADALVLFFLEHAQEFALQLERDLAHLVEEERAAVRRLESAGAVFDRAGERAFGMAEEFALVKLARDRGAIDADERLLAAAAPLGGFASDHFLAGAAFSQNQHRG